jgi:hypothetical protein
MAITAEQLEQLIQRLTPKTRKRHFTHYTARFGGTRSHEAIEDFIASADFYKDSEEIAGANALSGLSILLQGDAFKWWVGVKSTITTWENAKKAIRDEFDPRPPAHRIYQIIFETKQDANTPTGLFIAQKRALLAQVTPPDSESRQIEFLYGLLRQEIKDKIPQTSIATFYELLVLAKLRDVEGMLQERKKEKVRPNDENGRNRCEYCHNFGHTVKDCRKKAKRVAQQTAERNNVAQAANNTNFSCYGCGHPGVIRRNCPNTRSTRHRVYLLTSAREQASPAPSCIAFLRKRDTNSYLSQSNWYKQTEVVP